MGGDVRRTVQMAPQQHALDALVIACVDCALEKITLLGSKLVLVCIHGQVGLEDVLLTPDLSFYSVVRIRCHPPLALPGRDETTDVFL